MDGGAGSDIFGADLGQGPETGEAMEEASVMQRFLLDTFLPAAIMAVLSIVLIAWSFRLVLFFYYRFRNRRTPNPHEKRETMGLPKGAIRTFFALSFTAIAILAILGGDQFVQPADKKWVLGELGVVITFYFGSKVVETYVDSKAKSKAIEKATTAEEAARVYKDDPEAPRQTPS